MILPQVVTLDSFDDDVLSLRLGQDDELVEVTPESIRLRKVYLDPNERKRMKKIEAV